MSDNIKPINLVISQRSVLAPKTPVLLGTGDRQEKYAAQIENSFLPMLMAGVRLDGPHNRVMLEAFHNELNNATKMSEKTFTPVISVYVLKTLAAVANAIETNAPYAINLNYRLGTASRIDVSKVLVDFIKRHEGFFRELHAVLNPPPKPVLTEHENKLVS